MKYLIILIPIIFSTNLYSSLNETTVQVKTSIQSLSCNENSTDVILDIFIRKNNDIQDINLLSQNYRINLGVQGVYQDSYHIVSDGDMSGYFSYAPGDFYLFDPGTLTGTIKNAVSYNKEITAGDGFKLTTEWNLAGRIGFKINNNYECFETLVEQIEHSYFNTAIQVLLDGSEVALQSIDILGNSHCLQVLCDHCPQYKYLNAPTDNYQNQQQVLQVADLGIYANKTVGTGSQVEFRAGEFILLEPNFEIENNASFETKSEGCTTANQ